MNSQAQDTEHDEKVENPLLSAALGYAGLGWPVFPVWWAANGRCACGKADCQNPGKHPIGKLAPNGRNSATTAPKVIKGWWGEYPKASIGIPTGPESGLVVLDIDPRHGGDESKRKMERLGNFPITPMVFTGGNGEHIHLQHPGNGQKIKSQAELGGFPGIDLKGDGGYIVAPPSNHISGGQYSWKTGPDTPLAKIPDWLMGLLTQDDTSRRQSEAQEGEKIHERKRNTTLISLAGSMRRRGMSLEAIEAALLAENAARCDPPLPEKEVLTIARSVSRYEPGPDANPETEIERLTQDLTPDTPLPEILSRLSAMVPVLVRMGNLEVTGLLEVLKDRLGLSRQILAALRSEIKEAREKLRKSPPADKPAALSPEEEIKALKPLAAPLAKCPDVLGKVAEALRRRGLAGQVREAKIIYLAVTSRVLKVKVLVNVVVKGPSSGGKSYLVEVVLGFFPESAFYSLTAMSERALAYSQEPLSHRYLIIYEAAGLGSDFAQYLMRSLLSEGRVEYETVEETRDGLEPRVSSEKAPPDSLRPPPGQVSTRRMRRDFSAWRWMTPRSRRWRSSRPTQRGRNPRGLI